MVLRDSATVMRTGRFPAERLKEGTEVCREQGQQGSR